jgi:hypothetical protein
MRRPCLAWRMDNYIGSPWLDSGPSPDQIIRRLENLREAFVEPSLTPFQYGLAGSTSRVSMR